MRRFLSATLLLLFSLTAGCIGDDADSDADGASSDGMAEATSLEASSPSAAPVHVGSCALPQPAGLPNAGMRLGSASCGAADAGLTAWGAATDVLVEVTWDALGPGIMGVAATVEADGATIASASGTDAPLRMTFPADGYEPASLTLYVDVDGVAVQQSYTGWFSTFIGPVPEGYSAA